MKPTPSTATGRHVANLRRCQQFLRLTRAWTRAGSVVLFQSPYFSVARARRTAPSGEPLAGNAWVGAPRFSSQWPLSIPRGNWKTATPKAGANWQKPARNRLRFDHEELPEDLGAMPRKLEGICRPTTKQGGTP